MYVLSPVMSKQIAAMRVAIALDYREKAKTREISPGLRWEMRKLDMVLDWTFNIGAYENGTGAHEIEKQVGMPLWMVE